MSFNFLRTSVRNHRNTNWFSNSFYSIWKLSKYYPRIYKEDFGEDIPWWTGCCGRSILVLPCTVIALIPHASNSFTKLTDFSISGNILKQFRLERHKNHFKFLIYRILQVTGIFKLFTSVLRIFFAFSGFPSSATPIPPLTENCFGHPILISMPAMSSCTWKYTKIVNKHYQDRTCNTLPFGQLLEPSQHLLFQFAEPTDCVRLHLCEIQ